MFKRLVLFVVLCLLSPWFWLLFKNHASPLSRPGPKFELNTDFYLTQINTYRGETSANGLGFAGKAIINKYTWMVKEGATRMLESFDPHYLFMEGDLNSTRSTGKNGLVYLWLLVPVVWQLTLISEKQRIVWVGILFLSTIGSIFYMENYYSPAKIPMFILFDWLAACGLLEIFSLKNRLKYAYFLVLLFEVAKFFHQFFLHYQL